MTAVVGELAKRDSRNKKYAARIPPACTAFPVVIDSPAKTLRLAAADFTGSIFPVMMQTTNFTTHLRVEFKGGKQHRRCDLPRARPTEEG